MLGSSMDRASVEGTADDTSTDEFVSSASEKDS